MINIDTTNMCSHLQKKLFDEDGVYHQLWMAMQDDPLLNTFFLHFSHRVEKKY